MSLQDFFERFIADAEMLVKVFDANIREVVFRGRWYDIKQMNKEYRGPRYEVKCVGPINLSDYNYEQGLCITIDLKR